MAYLRINQDKVTVLTAKLLVDICPFSAMHYENGKLIIDSGCRMCKICAKKGPAGVVELLEAEEHNSIDKSGWNGIAVYAEYNRNEIHNVVPELIGKARELAKLGDLPVYALMIGHGVKEQAIKLLEYGVDKVFVYDYLELSDFKIDIYANVFEDFILKVKPSSILTGATKLGRMLAPRVAARFRTGLTADCTMLEMKENTDLVQIRPAFGGNIMARIVTPRNRPQFCTVRYKVFSAPLPEDTPKGEIVAMEIAIEKLISRIEITDIEEKPREMDISEAETIIAIGRGIKSRADVVMIEELAALLDAQIACSRPLVEGGWFDAKRQIGLSGRTVKAKLIIAAGISGAIQFAAGMQGSECIVAINSDPSAPIFSIAHYALVGDLYEIIPGLIKQIKDVKNRGI